MSSGQEASSEQYGGPVSVLSSFINRFILAFIKPQKAFQQIKDFPNLLSIIIIPLMLTGLAFLKYYVFYKFKIIIPTILLTPEIAFFTDSVVQFLVINHLFYLLLGILLALLIFQVGRWLMGGYGDWRQGASVIGYIHVPNVLGMIITILIVLLIPPVETGVVTYVRNASTEVAYPINIGLYDYITENSNLTVRINLNYEIPIDVVKYNGNMLKGITKITGGVINFTYITVSPAGLNETIQSIKLENKTLDYNVPIVVEGIEFNISRCTDNCTEKLILNMILLLNNTYMSPVERNMSIPFIIHLNVVESGLKTKSYDIKSNCYLEIIQIPNPKPLSEVVVEKINPVEQFLTMIVTIWQVFLLAIASKIIHEFEFKKYISLAILYVIIRFLLVGFTV
ncbi:MAG: YIP1 family protein [Thermoproteota archaeon]